MQPYARTAAVAGFGLAILLASNAKADPPPDAQWQLTWSDEFDGTSVDSSKWSFWLPNQMRRAAVNLPSNTFVSDGNLTVRIGNDNGQITAGGIQSKAGFGYGYYEVRAKVLGGWAGFWMQSPGIDGVGNPAANGTEMDIQEACCPGAVQHAVHWDGYDASTTKMEQHTISTSIVPDQTAYNVYGMEWTSDSYKFWVNGQLSWTFTTAISQRNDEWIRLTQETNGDYCGGQCLYVIDYVRAYKNVGPATGTGGAGGMTSAGGTTSTGGATSKGRGGHGGTGKGGNGSTMQGAGGTLAATAGGGATMGMGGSMIGSGGATMGTGADSAITPPGTGGATAGSGGATAAGEYPKGFVVEEPDGGPDATSNSASASCSVALANRSSWCDIVWALGLMSGAVLLQVRHRAPLVQFVRLRRK
jgi:beta-glucanase (GH16 family)